MQTSQSTAEEKQQVSMSVSAPSVSYEQEQAAKEEAKPKDEEQEKVEDDKMEVEPGLNTAPSNEDGGNGGNFKHKYAFQFKPIRHVSCLGLNKGFTI